MSGPVSGTFPLRSSSAICSFSVGEGTAADGALEAAVPVLAPAPEAVLAPLARAPVAAVAAVAPGPLANAAAAGGAAGAEPCSFCLPPPHAAMKIAASSTLVRKVASA